MTKKILTLLTFVAISLATTKIANAECDGFYLAGRLGMAKYTIEDARGSFNDAKDIVDKDRFLASGALGYRHKHVRAELEYIWRDDNKGIVGDITDISFESQSYMFALYYDFFPYTWFTPYVNAGVGYTKSKVAIKNITTGDSYKFKDNSFMWSLGAGISVKVTNRLNVDVGYRYFDMGNTDLKVYGGKTTLENQEIYLGMRYVL
jgi:opacity protein-like surface antigen